MVEFRRWWDEGDGFRWGKQLQIVGWIESKSETKVEDEFMISFLFLMMAGSELEIRHWGHIFSNAVKFWFLFQKRIWSGQITQGVILQMNIVEDLLICQYGHQPYGVTKRGKL